MTPNPIGGDLEHRNLTRLARATSMPEPTATQHAAWKTATSQIEPTPIKQGILSMKNPRTYAWIGSGIAAAAALAIVAILTGRPEPVRADTILQGLRDTLARGFKVSFNNVGNDGTKLNGQLTMLFGHDAADASGNANAAQRSLETLYGDMRVLVGAPSDMAGTDLTLTLAHSSDAKWAYLRAAGIPEDADQNELTTRMLNSARNGVLIDLAGIGNGGAVQSGAHGVQVLTGGSPQISNDPELQRRIDAAVREATAEALAHGGGVGVKAVDASAVISSDGQSLDLNSLPPEVREALANSNGTSVQAQHSFKIGFAIGSASGDPNADAQAVSNLMLGLDNNNDGHADLVSTLIQNILSNNPGQTQLDDLTQLLNGAAAQSSVQETEPDFFVLTANQLHGGDALPSDATLRIGYRRDHGVEWAQLENVEGGTIRFERTDGPVDPELLNKNRLIEPGVTRVIDSNNPWTLLGLLGANNDPPQP